MSVVGKPGWTFGADVVSGAITEMIRRHPDPEELTKYLAAGLPVTNLDKLRGVLTSLDAIDNPELENPAAAMAMRDVLENISAPQRFIDLIARIFNSTPKRVANLVTDRLDQGVVVDRDTFISATANTAVDRRTLDESEVDALERLPDTLKELGLKDTAAMASAFVERYAALTGAAAVFEPESVVRLYRDEGEHVLGYLKRQVRLSLIGEAADDKTSAQFKGLMDEVFTELDRHGVLPNTSVLGGFAKTGLSGALYESAQQFEAIDRGGVMDGSRVLESPAYVDRGIVFGLEKGSARALFDDLSASSMMMAVSPNAEDVKRIHDHCKMGGVAIVMNAGGEKIAAAEIPGVLQLDLDAAPADNAVAIAQYVRTKLVEERGQGSFVSAAEHLAMSDAPTEINEIRQWAKKESTRYRLLRLKNAALAKLATAHPDASIDDLTGWALDFARNIVRHTHGIDNFEKNAEWQAAAHEAIKASAPEIQALSKDLSADVMWNSWFGIREFNATPSYFDENTANLKFRKDLEHLDQDCAHTFNKDAYAEIRLDYITTKFLNAEDSAPEVFLGSKEEMQLYYRAKGYEFDCTTHDSNGTDFHYFRNTDESKPSVMVLHGIDSEARMTQMAALMKVNGVDPNRCVVRGEIGRVRGVNRSMLEQRIMEVTSKGDKQQKLAAVMVGNKNETIDAIAEAAGVDPSALKVSEHRAGPFRFRAVEVTPVGDDEPQVILAFAPAYGQLSQDLVEAAATLGVRPPEGVHFMLGGAGGSLNPDDAVNDVHQVTQAVHGDKRISLRDVHLPGVMSSPHLQMIEMPEDAATEAANVFSETPLEQDQRWLARVRQNFEGVDAPTTNVDQETWAVFEGLYNVSFAINGLDPNGKPLIEGATLPDPTTFFVQPTLVQSDVVGQGHLAGGTVGAGYGDRIKTATHHFIERLGVGGVVTKDGLKAIDGAKPGELSKQAKPKVARSGVGSVDALMPNMETMITSWKSSAEQFKGEKRPFRIVADRFGPDEEKVLEKLLSTLNPADMWIVVDAADPHNEKVRQAAKRYEGALAPKSRRIRDLAEKYGFETILMALDSEKPSIRGHFDFLLTYEQQRGDDDNPGKFDVIERFMQHGNREEDPNYSIPRTIVLGAERPDAHAVGPAPGGLDDAALDRFLGFLADVQEEIAGAEQDPKKKADQSLEARDQVLDKMADRWADHSAAGVDVRENVGEILEYLQRRAAVQGFHYTGGLSEAEVDTMVGDIKREVNVAFEGGVQMFADGLTHRYDGLIPAITDRYHAKLKDGEIEQLPARTGEKPIDAPQFYPVDGLDEFFGVGDTNQMRKPILWAGASRSSWPNIAPESQHALHLFVEIMAKVMKDKKDEFAQVTGGTKWGFEGIVHEVFSREGWHILGTLAQNTSVTDEKWEPDDRIAHWTFTGINWYGVARPVTDDIILPRDGVVVDVAGGGIAKDQIGLQLALNADAWLMTGIEPSQQGIEALREKLQQKADKAAGGKADTVVLTDEQKRNVAGASVEMGEQFPTRAFGTLDKLCEKMGLSEVLDLVKAEAKIDGPLKIAELEPLAKSLEIDTKTIKQRYPAEES